MKNKKIILMAMGLFLSGCLVTRQSIRENVKGEPLSPEQQRSANSEVRYQEMDEQMRLMHGRVESVEHSLSVLNADKSGSQVEALNSRKDLNEKLKIYEEAISKLETQYLTLAQKIEALELDRKSTAGTGSANSKSSSKNSYELAEIEFSKKKWKEAIVAFEKYRSINSSGKHYGEATYKIGFSFQELGMKTEAKAFYAEVVEKYPRSDWAKKAQSRLKTLK